LFGLAEKIERELVSFNDLIIVDGHWNEVYVLFINAGSVKIYLDNAIEDDLVRCLDLPASASFLFKVQFNKLVVLQEGINIPIYHCLIQLIVSVLRVRFEST